MSGDLLGIEHHPCTTAQEFLSKLSPTDPLWDRKPHSQDGRSTHGWIFRGQGDDIPMIASALRPTAKDKFEKILGKRPYALDQIQNEFWTLREFIKAIDASGLPIPNDSHVIRVHYRLHATCFPKRLFEPTHWPPDEVLPVLGLAQHYGLPTRLVDWSRRSFVGAYFAAESIAKCEQCQTCADDMVVWALNLECIVGLCDRYIPIPNYYDENPPRVSVVEAPQATNPNLAAQAGVFVLDRRAGPKEGFEVTFPRLFLEHLGGGDDPERVLRQQGYSHILRKITLPHSEARSLLQLLGLHGVTAASIYPGHKGVVEAMYEKQYWEPSPWFDARPRSP